MLADTAHCTSCHWWFLPVRAGFSIVHIVRLRDRSMNIGKFGGCFLFGIDMHIHCSYLHLDLANVICLYLYISILYTCLSTDVTCHVVTHQLRATHFLENDPMSIHVHLVFQKIHHYCVMIWMILDAISKIFPFFCRTNTAGNSPWQRLRVRPS